MKSKRVRFFLWHFFISICISLISLFWVFNAWYPGPLAKATNVTYIFLMLLAIDIILGPILGFVVYNEKKKTLKFDLAVIFLLQLSALAYGVYSISQARPVWIVYNVDRFELVRKNELIEDNIQQAQLQFQQPSWFKPEYAATEFAKNTQQRNDDMFAEIMGGISIAQRPERYVDFAQAKEQIQKRAQNLDLLNQYNDKTDVEKILSKYPQATAFLPMKASVIDMTVLIDSQGDVVKIVDLRPWK